MNTDEQLLKKLDAIISVIDKLGFNQLGLPDVHGTTEKIAMELSDMNKHLSNISSKLSEISTSIDMK